MSPRNDCADPWTGFAVAPSIPFVLAMLSMILLGSGCGPAVRPGVTELQARLRTTGPNIFTGDPEVVRNQLLKKYDSMFGCVGVGISKPVWSTTALSESAARNYADSDYEVSCDPRKSKELGYPMIYGLALIDRWVNVEGTIFIDVVVNTRDAPIRVRER